MNQAPEAPNNGDFVDFSEEFLAGLTPEERIQIKQEDMKRQADHVCRTFAEFAAKRSQLLGNGQPALGAEGVLNNGLYVALSDASDQPMLGSPMLPGGDLSRPGFTASLALASFYSSLRNLARMEREYHGEKNRYPEMMKLVNILAPLVAEIDPVQENEVYLHLMTQQVQQQRAA